VQSLDPAVAYNLFVSATNTYILPIWLYRRTANILTLGENLVFPTLLINIVIFQPPF